MTAIGETAWTKLGLLADALTEEDLRALSPIVVLAPHPDDETLGCGGLLAKATSMGLKPRVVYLTDGSASHRASKQWPPSRLAEVRRAEALAALAILGVEADDILFLGWPDAAPYRPNTSRYEAAFAQMSMWLDTFGPSSIWAPRSGESHCDHAAACDLADDLKRRRPAKLRRLDYMVWGWADDMVASQRGDEQVWRLCCVESTLMRRRALACHLTQTTGLIADAEDAFLIPDNLAALSERPAEIFIERRSANVECRP